MSRSPQSYNFNDIAAAFVTKAANYISYRYRHYGVVRDDVKQELFVWLYSDDGISKVTRWLDAEPQRTTRIYRTLLDLGIEYGEREKAERVGYSVDDITYYTPSMVDALMPLVLDDEYTGGLDGQKAPGSQHGRKSPNETGDLLAMVVDVRQAVDRMGLHDYFLKHDSEDDAWRDSVQMVINCLGGDGPRIGRRRVMSNAQSQAITRDQA